MVYGKLRFLIRISNYSDDRSDGGIPYDELGDDPQLGSKRTQLVTAAAKKLASARMIRFDETLQNFTITEVGRIAAKYYIRHATIEIFNEDFKPVMSEADVLAVLSRSTEVCKLVPLALLS